MFKNYLTIALRNLKRQKLYAFINIFGLALGIACCILMTLFVKHEWSHDQFHENKDQIYRLISHEIHKDGTDRLKSLHKFSALKQISETLPGVAQASGYMDTQARISSAGHIFYERFGEVNANFLKIFSFPLLVGNPESALAQPNAVVISESMVQKFFDDIQPNYSNIIGQPLTFHGNKDKTFTITGVMKDVPQNSSLKFNFLIPISNNKNFRRRMSNGNFLSVFIALNKNQDPVALQATLPAFAETHLAKDFQRFQKKGVQYTLSLQSLNEMYWNPITSNAYEKKGNPFATYLLSIIAVLVLLIACSNFMTLAIGRSTSRATEVGIRKVVGAQRKQLMQQFLGETILLSFIALIIGIAIAELFLPIFNELIQKELTISYFGNSALLFSLLGFMVIIGLISGSYPAIILSRFQPVQTLKGQTRIGGRSNITRTLVILQYTASIALVISTGVIMKQQDYMQTKDMGFNKESVVIIDIPGNDDGRDKIAERFKKSILTHSQVINASISDRTPTGGTANYGFDRPDGTMIVVRVQRVDTDYIETLNLTLLEGRNFSQEHATDGTQAILVNEAFVKEAEIKKPVGAIFEEFKVGKVKKPVIIGVIKDFHTSSLHEKIPPLALQITEWTGDPKVLIRIRPNDISGTLTFLKEKWQQVAPGWEFHQSFLDENLEQQYRDEKRWQQVLTYSSLFTIAISCLGLLGLASLAVSRRTKEIGIRKVLGASVPNLVNLLSLDFIKLLLIANIIAWSIAYYAMNQWLANFAYHIELGIGVFAFSGALTLCIALFTVCTQTLKAARNNPVNALRYE